MLNSNREYLIDLLVTHPWTPAWASGDPADLCVTDSAAQPITAFLLLDDDATLGTVHRLTRPDQSLRKGKRERAEKEQKTEAKLTNQ